jgi:hypothetical protein
MPWIFILPCSLCNEKLTCTTSVIYTIYTPVGALISRSLITRTGCSLHLRSVHRRLGLGLLAPAATKKAEALFELETRAKTFGSIFSSRKWSPKLFYQTFIWSVLASLENLLRVAGRNHFRRIRGAGKLTFLGESEVLANWLCGETRLVLNRYFLIPSFT